MAGSNGEWGCRTRAHGIRKSVTDGTLLNSFAEDYAPSGTQDRPHPIRALQRMRTKESWEDHNKNISTAAKPILVRLQSLDKLIEPKLKEYQELLAAAEVAEKEQKFLAAAALLRKAHALESAR